MPNSFVAQIQSKLGEKREAIQRLDRERDRLRAEMAAYEEMLIIAASHEGEAETKAPADNSNGEVHHSSRGLSPTWRAIMKRLAVKERFNFDDAINCAAKEGLEIDKKSTRSRMHTYAQSGYVERVGEGIFRVTPKGHGVAG